MFYFILNDYISRVFAKWKVINVEFRVTEMYQVQDHLRFKSEISYRTFTFLQRTMMVLSEWASFLKIINIHFSIITSVWTRCLLAFICCFYLFLIDKRTSAIGADSGGWRAFGISLTKYMIQHIWSIYMNEFQLYMPKFNLEIYNNKNHKNILEICWKRIWSGQPSSFCNILDDS